MDIKFHILWLENSLGIAINQSNSDIDIPLTGYYFWPRNDVWEQIRIELSTKKWITEGEKILILNSVTEILNNWQKNTKEEIIQNNNSFTLVAST